MKRGLRILIAVPVRDTVMSGFAHDLAVMMAYTTAVGMGTVEWVHLEMQPGTLIADQRHQLTRRAIQMGATHILWLDADMRFPPETLVRLLARNVDVVACNYATRKVPSHPVAMVNLKPPSVVTFVFSDEGQTGLQEVEAVGMGVMLTKVEALLKAEPPLFNITWVDDQTSSGYTGEDVFMCEKLRALGVTIWVDHDLSQQVRHVGSFEYTQHHAGTWRNRFAPDVTVTDTERRQLRLVEGGAA